MRGLCRRWRKCVARELQMSKLLLRLALSIPCDFPAWPNVTSSLCMLCFPCHLQRPLHTSLSRPKLASHRLPNRVRLHIHELTTCLRCSASLREFGRDAWCTLSPSDSSGAASLPRLTQACGPQEQRDCPIASIQLQSWPWLASRVNAAAPAKSRRYGNHALVRRRPEPPALAACHPVLATPPNRKRQQLCLAMLPWNGASAEISLVRCARFRATSWISAQLPTAPQTAQRTLSPPRRLHHLLSVLGADDRVHGAGLRHGRAAPPRVRHGLRRQCLWCH